MKILNLFIAGMMLAGTVSAQATLEVTITNIDTREGTIMVALHNTSESFPNDAGYRTAEATADASEVTVSFENLDAGEYALSVFHDVNDNDELDKNIMGIPKEPFGFSNDAMGTFGAPSFEKCIIKVPANGKVQTKLTLKSI